MEENELVKHCKYFETKDTNFAQQVVCVNNQKLVVCGCHSGVLIFDFETGEMVKKLTNFDGWEIYSIEVIFSESGVFAVGEKNYKLFCIDVDGKDFKVTFDICDVSCTTSYSDNIQVWNNKYVVFILEGRNEDENLNKDVGVFDFSSMTFVTRLGLRIPGSQSRASWIHVCEGNRDLILSCSNNGLVLNRLKETDEGSVTCTRLSSIGTKFFSVSSSFFQGNVFVVGCSNSNKYPFIYKIDPKNDNINKLELMKFNWSSDSEIDQQNSAKGNNKVSIMDNQNVFIFYPRVTYAPLFLSSEVHQLRAVKNQFGDSVGEEGNGWSSSAFSSRARWSRDEENKVDKRYFLFSSNSYKHVHVYQNLGFRNYEGLDRDEKERKLWMKDDIFEDENVLNKICVIEVKTLEESYKVFRSLL